MLYFKTIHYNIARALVLSNSYVAIMAKISIYARSCVYNMACTVSF